MLTLGGAHVQRGLLHLVCLSVCLSVCYRYSDNAGYEAANERYQRLQCYVGINFKMAISPFEGYTVYKYSMVVYSTSAPILFSENVFLSYTV